jgi:hypothetical protein
VDFRPAFNQLKQIFANKETVFVEPGLPVQCHLAPRQDELFQNRQTRPATLKN